MQTFLPFADFDKTARVLDRARLGKQRVEALQILRAIHDPAYGWQHHPAVRMWRNHPVALVDYGLAICLEWDRRGYTDSCAAQILEFAPSVGFYFKPDWLGREDFHSTHRAVLLGKNFEYYSQFGWAEKPAVKVNGSWPYIWPR